MAQRGTESFEDYDGFVKKFEPKKTTDDCYTPPEVYDAVLGYVVDRYGIDKSKVLRPFFPGGDFEADEYPQGWCVVDNPPFSIMARIIRFYVRKGIRFFLFAPGLTLFSAVRPGNGVSYIACCVNVVYANGAGVNTGFVTNMGDGSVLAESCPELRRRVESAVARIRSEKAKRLPKYEFPANVVTSSMLGQLSKYGVPFELRYGDAVRIAGLDAMGSGGIYGGAFLISEKAAAEKAAAGKAAAEKAAAHVWGLSKRELAIIDQLAPLPCGDGRR